MSMSLKILPALALAVALSSLAGCQALGPLNHQNQVMTGSATIDDPTTVYSGGPAPRFPVSYGG
jgi:predicted small lipoprotein YifL